MALEQTFSQLEIALHKLYDAFEALQVNIGDTPPNDDIALADALENKMVDMMSTLHHIRRSYGEAQSAVTHPVELDNARHALTKCQQRFHELDQQFTAELLSQDNLKEVMRVGKERRGWMPWSNSIRKGIEQCRQSMEATSAPFAECWQELAERLGGVNISMKATNVGQQITVAKPGVENWEIEGVT
ncbi:MAG TPA: hypothetical protein VHN74_04170 [Candidatus Angelobacter sp.]|jgi:hypothetical protein|nr:hypothetical protein [Candidatus Angelobacter sp.]